MALGLEQGHYVTVAQAMAFHSLTIEWPLVNSMEGFTVAARAFGVLSSASNSSSQGLGQAKMVPKLAVCTNLAVRGSSRCLFSGGADCRHTQIALRARVSIKDWGQL